MDSFDSLSQECDQLELIAAPGIRDATRKLWECPAAAVRADDDVEIFDASMTLRNAADALASIVRTHFGIEK